MALYETEFWVLEIYLLYIDYDAFIIILRVSGHVDVSYTGIHKVSLVMPGNYFWSVYFVLFTLVTPSKILCLHMPHVLSFTHAFHEVRYLRK